MSDMLTPQRLFSEPSLRVAQPSQFQFSPCGNYVSFLQQNNQRSRQLDLWLFDQQTESKICLLDASEVADEPDEDITKLSTAERAERERRRQFTQGITNYYWCPDATALVACVDGQAFLVPLDQRSPVRLTNTQQRHTAFCVSPKGTYLSYVRDNDLFFRPLTPAAQAAETRVSIDGSATVTNGLADFLAAEEMHRFEGHWWSPDETVILFCKVDDANVAISNRMEVDATGSRSVEQRYPFAGAVNPSVALWQYTVDSKQQQQIWRDNTDYAYLARVNAFQDGAYIQCQDRLQQSLTILRKGYSDSTWSNYFSENSETWINLSDDLTELSNGKHAFTTESSGNRAVILLSDNASPQELNGPNHVNRIVGADSHNIYVCGWDNTPIENHLYAVPLDGTAAQTLTTANGWHDVIVNTEKLLLLDRFTSDNMPLNIVLKSLNASGAREHVLFEEKIAPAHPYFSFLDNHVSSDFGSVKASNGQPLYFRLTPPLHPHGKHPVIVYVYGGPGAQKVRLEWSPLLLQLFAHQGFGVLELDNRGSTNRGRDFEAPLYQRMGSVEVADQLLGIEMLKDVSWADLDNLGIFGHSYGGYMTLMSLCKAASVYKAGVAVAPVSDWTLYDSHYTERYMGLPQDNAAAYEQSSVIAHLDKLSCPLLLIHGMADDNVLFTHSTLIMAELQKLGKPFDLMTYPGAKHSMQETHVSIHRFNTILTFFNRHLKRETDA